MDLLILTVLATIIAVPHLILISLIFTCLSTCAWHNFSLIWVWYWHVRRMSSSEESPLQIGPKHIKRSLTRNNTRSAYKYKNERSLITAEQTITTLKLQWAAATKHFYLHIKYVKRPPNPRSYFRTKNQHTIIFSLVPETSRSIYSLKGCLMASQLFYKRVS